MKLKFCLIVDVEDFISFRQINPRWGSFEKLKGKLNSYIKNFRYNKNGFDLIYNIIKQYKFPINLMIVGSLFKPKDNENYIEWGYHTYNHLSLTLADDETIKREIKNIYSCKSFNAPLWMIEDLKNPDRIFNLLKKEGYRTCIYRGPDKGITHFHRYKIIKPINKCGIKCIHVSNHVEGNSTKSHLESVKKEILNHLNHNAIYCLTTHDFTHKNTDNLEEILEFVLNLKKENKLDIVKLSDIK